MFCWETYTRFQQSIQPIFKCCVTGSKNLLDWELVKRRNATKINCSNFKMTKLSDYVDEAKS